MKRNVFFSFHYKPDCMRAAQVRQMGVLEGNAPVSDNDWEAVTEGGEAAIKGWIAGQLVGRSCAVVLVGQNTAGRKWINYEIVSAWDAGKGVVGVYVHNLEDPREGQCAKGKNPFDFITYGKTGARLSTIVKAYDPGCVTGAGTYAHIQSRLADWVEEAIEIRSVS